MTEHTRLAGKARGRVERQGYEIQDNSGPTKSFNPDIYGTKYARDGTLTEEVLVEVEVTFDDVWKDHTRKQLRKAHDYCSPHCKSRRVAILAVPSDVAGNAKAMLRVNQLRRINIWRL